MSVADAIASGRLGGHAADVFEMEDWDVKDRRREIPQSLLDDRNRTFFTPHVGSAVEAVEAVRSKIEIEAVENILHVLVRKSKPRSAVNQVVD